MATYARRPMPSFYLRHAVKDCSLASSGVYLRKKDSRYDQGPSLCGTSEKLACGDGRTESHGVRAECQGAS